MLNWETVKENLQELLTEFMVYVSQTMVVFLVAVFSSSFLTDQAKLEAFSDSKISTASMPELVFTFAAILVCCVVLGAGKWVLGGSMLSGIVREALLEFPRTIYLFGSAFAGVAMAIAIYVGAHPGVGARTAAWWWWVALAMTFYGFGFGLLVKNVLSSKWLNGLLGSGGQVMADLDV